MLHVGCTFGCTCDVTSGTDKEGEGAKQLGVFHVSEPVFWRVFLCGTLTTSVLTTSVLKSGAFFQKRPIWRKRPCFSSFDPPLLSRLKTHELINIFQLFPGTFSQQNHLHPTWSRYGYTIWVLILDFCMWLRMRRGTCNWGPGKTVLLIAMTRGALSLFSGDLWLVGIGLSYFVVGNVLAIDIVNTRVRTRVHCFSSWYQCVDSDRSTYWLSKNICS